MTAQSDKAKLDEQAREDASFRYSFQYNTYTQNDLDRLNNSRKDTELLKNLRERDNSVFVPFYKLKPLLRVSEDPSKSKIGWLHWKEIEEELKNNEDGLKETMTIVLLGKKNEIAYFAVDVTSKVAEGSDTFIKEQKSKFSELRTSVAALDPVDAAILGQGRALLDFHQRNRYCSNCGSLTELAEGGSKRKCTNVTNCKAQHFPRTDPCVIMAVISKRKKENNEEEEVCLLGRQSIWPKGMYSCLAGFLEPGESIEEAIKREVKEEAGIDLDVEKIWYHSSQPWPYPSQLMIGCVAFTQYAEITTTLELEEAHWANKETVRKALKVSEDINSYYGSTEFRMPPPFSVAHQLIRFWALSSISMEDHFKDHHNRASN